MKLWSFENKKWKSGYGRPPSVKSAADAISAEPQRPAGQTDVIGLRCDPIPVVRMAFIGVGSRGSGAVSRFLNIDGVEVKAICDLEQSNLDRIQAHLTEIGRPEAAMYTGEEDWKKVCERDDIDLVYIATHWALHTPISVYAMEQGKHVISEIPIAKTIEECWQLVNTAERTRRHCMMLENTCYDFFELATLNMAQQGLFGELVHVEGAYIHDLREYMFGDRIAGDRPSYWNFWRLRENAARNGALYPMHGLGPIAQLLNIGRGDKMDYLVALGSDQFNMTAYAKEKYGENSSQAQMEINKGDMTSVLIKTAKGKSMLIQHDVTSPRPYDRLHTVSGTKGFAKKYPIQQLAFDEANARGQRHARILNNEEMAAKLKEYEFSFITEVREFAEKVGGHGGMDFILEYRVIKCLQKGLPLDMNVYDGVSWSAVIPLSEFSIANGSYPVKVPDFTRGGWQKVQGFRHTSF
jgi:predicted dehydrogenase